MAYGDDSHFDIGQGSSTTGNSFMPRTPRGAQTEMGPPKRRPTYRKNPNRPGFAHMQSMQQGQAPKFPPFGRTGGEMPTKTGGFGSIGRTGPPAV